MIIIEYEKKFTELARYAIAYVMDEKDKCKLFEGVLRATIQTPVTTSTNWSDFS